MIYFLKSMVRKIDPPAIFIWGPPGIGKSTICCQVAKEKKLNFIDLRMALMDPTDLRGIPIPEKGRAKWLSPSALPTRGRGILFLDELNLAPPLVQSSAYQLILDRKIGEYTFPKGWYIIAAGNKVWHGANVYKMAAPLRNRFLHLSLEINLEDWLEWAIKNKIAPEVIGFISFKPRLLFQFNPRSDEDAFPTPRTWEMVSKIIKKHTRLGSEILSQVIAGAIGWGATLEFKEYLKSRNCLPSIDAILGGKKVDPPARADIAYTLALTLAAQAQPKQFEYLLRYSQKLSKEVAVLMIKLLEKKDRKSLQRCGSWPAWLKKHRSVMARSR